MFGHVKNITYICIINKLLIKNNNKMKINENNSTKIILVLTALLFVCLASTKRASAQYTELYSNTFNDATEWVNLGVEQFVVDTIAPYGSFVSNYMGAIQSVTANDGYAMLDLDAQVPAGNNQIGILASQFSVEVSGFNEYFIVFQSYYGKYDGNDSIYLNLFKSNPAGVGVLDTSIRLDVGQDAGTIVDSMMIINLSDFLSNGDEFSFNFTAYSGWGLAWLIDDFAVLGQDAIVSSTLELPTFNGVREVTTIINMLGQPVTTMERGQVYVKLYNDGTKEKVSIR